MVVISVKVYNDIAQFIERYNGLGIDCDDELKKRYSRIPPETICSISSKIYQLNIKTLHSVIASKAKEFLEEFEFRITTNPGRDILLKIAVREKFPPVGLCRIILNEKYGNILRKTQISEALKNPNLVPDPWLAANTKMCLFNDNRDGVISDTIRRCIGEEYEVRLKMLAREAKMIFNDENDLRQTGFDKTPDIKLAVPCSYKGKIIHWIESKASFGDMESHEKHITTQLAAYGNRFGAGIVIYWLGYLESIVNFEGNGDLISVTDSFPCTKDLEMLQFIRLSC